MLVRVGRTLRFSFQFNPLLATASSTKCLSPALISTPLPFHTVRCFTNTATSSSNATNTATSSQAGDAQGSGGAPIDANGFQSILTEKKGAVGILTLNRPKQLNALSDQVMLEVIKALQLFQEDKSVGVIILTGNGKAFAAGADIKEMSKKNFPEVLKTDMLEFWAQVTKIRKPIIAAVNGYALGGGCELAMMCDIIIAADTASFGQPEVKIGTIPGGGGTQRLIREIGKSRAMEMILTALPITAQEAEKYGLVSRIVPTAKLMEETLKTAEAIASMSQPVVALAKEAVNAAYESNLQHGLGFERRLFHSTFALSDRKEGMTAFMEKRAPQWHQE